ncbi:MAG: hypothetical protein AB7F86_04465 [Bdellovibrionales bacterium]
MRIQFLAIFLLFFSAGCALTGATRRATGCQSQLQISRQSQVNGISYWEASCGDTCEESTRYLCKGIKGTFVMDEVKCENQGTHVGECVQP